VSNRRGLLHLLTTVFQELDLDILDAKLETRGGVAHVFMVTENGGQVASRHKLERLPELVAARLDQDDRENIYLATLTRTADILVVAVGYPELVRCDAAALVLYQWYTFEHLHKLFGLKRPIKHRLAHPRILSSMQIVTGARVSVSSCPLFPKWLSACMNRACTVRMCAFGMQAILHR
jgi:hypothetical protein